MDIITILGSLASIISAIWAYVQAKKSSKYANLAKKIKEELIDRRKIAEVTKIYEKTDWIIKIVSQIGPTSTEENIRGLDCNNIAKNVEEYVRYLNEYRNQFGSSFEQKLSILLSQINPLIENLSVAHTYNDKKSAGKEIYYLITDFVPIIKDLFEKKKEQIKI